ncbi:hypothetical protein N624_0271 [Levilactobacillus brevis]|nr:hypothetical protein N624_0271 [Levilactobacillus brevis]
MNKILQEQFFVDDLSDDQKAVITDMNHYIKDSLNGQESAVAIIQGAAGTGKSVVLMELVRQYMTDKRYRTSLVVNHPELYKAYQDLAESIPNMKASAIRRPTSLINYAQKIINNTILFLLMRPICSTPNLNPTPTTAAKTS